MPHIREFDPVGSGIRLEFEYETDAVWRAGGRGKLI